LGIVLQQIQEITVNYRVAKIITETVRSKRGFIWKVIGPCLVENVGGQERVLPYNIMNKKNKIEREINTYSKITYSLNNVSVYNNIIDK